jgi:hypothetical protein
MAAQAQKSGKTRKSPEKNKKTVRTGDSAEQKEPRSRFGRL